ncbi:MAG: hypothetical protein K8S13_11030 [Desulfobacula sp.]|uniref:glycoside hydrolase family 3 N-terminal domain-containing protein n=1 Tax=Desulfobacula sp. TaxID=2593537 RepID=UPI0025C60A6F|nr:glycoside hydrolase family 3 N-terminal domain-containing protein [Desulfobacula sp.]MCD4720373.1 hypothetical protein [Desulfobacula sp.]
MEKSRRKNAHAVILPAFELLTLSDSVKRFLENGGCSILIGESREEYVSRKMSDERKTIEKSETFLTLIKEAITMSGDLIVAVDQEIGGICRLHDLVPPFPDMSKIDDFDIDIFKNISSSIAREAKNLRINCFLSPILDVVTGQNPWLHGRTWSNDPKVVGKITSAFIQMIQREGVAACAKHFPGFHNIALDPAIESEAVVTEAASSFKQGFIPFTYAITNKVEMIMVGPAIVEAFDKKNPASISPKIIDMLKKRLDFDGIVMSDDLDAQATLRGRSIEEIAVKALNAGSDFLLLADADDHIERVVEAICNAVEKKILPEKRLYEAGTKVRKLAQKYS